MSPSSVLSSSYPLEERIAHARSVSGDVRVPEHHDFLSLVRQRRNDDSTYLIYIDSNDNRIELSYRDFLSITMDCAAFLKSSGLRKGDRIATISHNHWHTVVHYFAAWVCGLVVVPVNLGEDDSRIAYILEKSDVRLCFVRDSYVQRIQQIIKSQVLNGISLVPCGKTTESFVITESGMNVPVEDFSELDSLIVFTSGTTGNPKGVVLSQRNLMEDAMAISAWHSITKNTRMMCVLPIHHVNGTVVTLCTPMYAGGSVVLNEKFRVGQFFPIIAQENVHIVSVVPTLLSFLTSHHEKKEKVYCPTLRHIICGAGPLTITVASQFEDRFGIRIVHGYGLSETTCYSCYLPVELTDEDHKHWMRDHGYPSIGVPLDINEMDLHDESGQPVGDGKRGEIVIRGRNVMKGYYDNIQANENAFTYGWFRSGDEGFALTGKDGLRYFFITGRLKELIIRGGVNLAPLEIDEIINQAPGVKAGISVGFENDWYGEEVGAYIQLHEGANPDTETILQFCRERLPFSKCPKVVVFGDDIPVTSTGKYQRMKVAHHFREWKSVQFRENKAL